MKTPLCVLVLAAGRGTRMKSELPKVLHSVAGRPMLEHVLAVVTALHPSGIGVVLGLGRGQIEKALREHGWKNWQAIHQPIARGSGDAVMMARSWLRRRKGALLVVYGDTPLLTTATLKSLVAAHEKSGHAATFLAMELSDPTGYGRIVLGADGSVERIVEHRDASADERQIRLVNSGVACWEIAALLKVLPQLRANNAKHEFYLTDAADLLRRADGRVGLVQVADAGETQGINNRLELSQAEAVARRRILERWMRAGVTIIDPATTYIEATVRLAADTRIWPGTLIRGESRIAAHCEIGPYSIIESSQVGKRSRVGPFARLRPGTVLDEGTHIGNFVEIKKSRIGRRSKVNHLSYIGDATLGSDVNVGAGTITCNYDGFAKHSTAIGDRVFIGSNANLVAPVRLGNGALVAAGSTVTADVPPETLAVARARQINKVGWAKRFRTQAKKRARHD